jgi:hypothetical protein
VVGWATSRNASGWERVDAYAMRRTLTSILDCLYGQAISVVALPFQEAFRTIPLMVSGHTGIHS